MSAAETPVVYISYHTENEVTIRELSSGLRRRNFPVYIVPFDLDEDGAALLSNMGPHSGRQQVLCLAITPSGEHWLETRFKSAVLDVIRDQLDEVYVVKLADFDDAHLPAEVRRAPVFDLSRDMYERGLEQLVDALGLAFIGEDTGAESKQQHATVTGIFEIARSQSDMFIELRNQIHRERRFDHKYLYWDVRAALRWQRLAELSTYMTNQMSMNLLALYSDSILEAIVSESKGKHFSFVNLGVGTGEKDFQILDALLRQSSGEVIYFPVDESLSLIQMTIQSLQDLMARFQRLTVHYVLDDFAHVDLFESRIRSLEREAVGRIERRSRRLPSPVRIIGLLGGSLGNFHERWILGHIRTLMPDGGYVIVGVEFVGGRDDDELIANYAGLRMREFLYGPILDVEGAPEGWSADENWDERVNPNDQDRSDVPDARTVVVSGYLRDQWIETVYSTKYEKVPLERFFESVGFRIVAAFTSDESPPRYGKYVLTPRS